MKLPWKPQNYLKTHKVTLKTKKSNQEPWKKHDIILRKKTWNYHKNHDTSLKLWKPIKNREKSWN